MLIHSLALRLVFQTRNNIAYYKCLLIYIKDISHLDNTLSDILANTLKEARKLILYLFLYIQFSNDLLLAILVA